MKSATGEAGHIVDERLDAILLERVARGSVAMTLSLAILTLVAWSRGTLGLAALSLGTQIAALLAWWAIRAGKVPVARAGLLSLGLWLCAEATIVTALLAYGNITQEVWLALILWAYGSMQFKHQWFAPAVVIGAGAWTAALLWIGATDLPLHFVSISGAVGVSALSFGANRAVLHDLERLRVQDRARQQDLERALAEARHEVIERQAAELEREQLRSQFIESQRLEAIGTLAGGLAHDMNNVLAGILGMARVLRLTAEGDAVEDLDAIVSSAERGVALTRSLLGFSRRAQYEKRQFSLAEVVTETLDLLRRTVPRSIALTHDLDEDVFVEADRAHMSQALMNVYLNSVQALGGSGEIATRVSIERVDREDAAILGIAPGEYAVLGVRDDGHGMGDEVRQRVFDPFFTTKRVGEGTGLGLAMVWGMLQSHGGTAIVESREGSGTVMKMLLPCHRGPVAREPVPPAAVDAPSRALHLLVVDDEPIVRRVTRRLVEQLGYRVTEAEDGVEAVEVFSASGGELDGVVLDMSMPRMNGAQCFHALRELRPDLPIVCVSGYALDEDARLHLGGDVVFLAKPFQGPDLAEALEQAIQRSSSADGPSGVR